ncbi:MAG TPA: hypothetical protein VFF81_08200 [Noviherbaspirillum sp.]|nr:hypothetical protein [Noviherbaspirillum sp.]
MRLSEANFELANELRKLVQEKTETISDGEGVALFLLWGFLEDHARIQGLDISQLARGQMESFIEFAKENLKRDSKH